MTSPGPAAVTTLPPRAAPGQRGGPAVHQQGAVPFADVLAAAGAMGPDPARSDPTANAGDPAAADASKPSGSTTADAPATPVLPADPAALLAQLGVPGAPTVHVPPAPVAGPAGGPTAAGPTVGTATATPSTAPSTAAPTTPQTTPQTTPPTTPPTTPQVVHHPVAGSPNPQAGTAEPILTPGDRPHPTTSRAGERAERPAAADAVAPEPGTAYLAAVSTPTVPHAPDAVAAPVATARAVEPQPALVAAVAHLRTRGDGTHELSAMLHPADLGAVHVRATLHGDQLTLVVACADDAARVAVTAALPDLHHQLGGLTSVDVQLGDRQAGRDAPRDTHARDTNGSLGHGDARHRERPDPGSPPRTRPVSPIDAALDQWM